MDTRIRHTTKENTTEKNKEPGTKYTEKETKCINDLKNLYMETINLDADMQRQVYNLEKAYETKHKEIYDKRSKMLETFKSQNQVGDEDKSGSIEQFWLKVLKASYTEFISKKDDKVLAYLEDIRSKLFTEPEIKFVLEFHFRPNKWFTNRILTKTYYLNCLPDPESPLTYNGAVIYKTEGCIINWNNPEEENEDKTFTSFFDFFNPPALPENPDDPEYNNIYQTLQNDFGLGFYLKETVIPKAILYFTGEFVDCNSSDTDSTDSYDNVEEDTLFQ